MIEYVIVNLGKVPSGNLSPYVALSWSRGQETIRLLCDLDDRFTTHPSNELREEDGRFERIIAETLVNYEAAGLV